MNWPNRLTLFRLLLVPFIIITIIYHKTESAFLIYYLPLFIFIVAAVTDAVDGFIARKYHLKTTIGTFLDPFADKTLILATLICLYFSPMYPLKMPAWVLVIIASRDFIIVTWLITSYATNTNFRIQPNMLGKITTGFQMLTIVCLILQLSCTVYLWNITLILTIASAISYIVREANKLQEVKEKNSIQRTDQ